MTAFYLLKNEARSWWHRRDCSTCRKLRMVSPALSALPYTPQWITRRHHMYTMITRLQVKLTFEALGKNSTGSEATPVSVRHATTYALAARPTSLEGVRGRGNTPDADLYVATSEGRLAFAYVISFTSTAVPTATLTWFPERRTIVSPRACVVPPRTHGRVGRVQERIQVASRAACS